MHAISSYHGNKPTKPQLKHTTPVHPLQSDRTGNKEDEEEEEEQEQT